MFLLARTSPLLEFAPYACAFVTIIGAITTVFAGTIGLVQNDFKSIIAYSTCSQLGYMVTICGLSNYDVGIFHLFNHSFFKALLFLTAGAVIHALANEQDIRKFGGLQQILIFSYCCLLIGTLALIGTPFLTGFYSKDVILELAYARYSFSAHFGYLLTCFSVFTTSFYSFRLLFLCFHSQGETKLSNQQSIDSYPPYKCLTVPDSSNASNNNSSINSDIDSDIELEKPHHIAKWTNLHKQSVAHAHDADWVHATVLIVLAVGSIYAGWWFKPMFIGVGTDFWNNSIFIKPENIFMIEAEFLPQSVKLLPLILTIFGALLAYAFTTVWVNTAYNFVLNYSHGVYVFLSHRWHYDKILNEALAYTAYNLGLNYIKTFDKGLLELLPMFGLGLPRSLQNAYVKLGYTQSGLIYHYATIMILAALCALTLLSFSNIVLFSDLRVLLVMCACLVLI